jgi:hypothetical protein
MKVFEIVEAVKTAFGSKGGKVTRKYRCTAGKRKGRVVAKMATCNAPIKLAKSLSMKRTKARLGGVMKVKRKQTMRTNPVSKAKQRLNRGGPKGR